VALSAKYNDGATNRGIFNFLPSSVASESTAKFSVKNIPGITPAGTYSITVTGDGSTANCAGTAPVNLKVERVGSDWQEF
ncbi:MAG: hypothetical protein AAB822_01430, partial [Patescibacteria group bacterium]